VPQAGQDSGLLPGSGEPHRDMGGLKGFLDHADQIAAYRVEIDGLAQPRGERGHDRLGMVACPVEPAVDGVLDPLAQRVEQRRGVCCAKTRSLPLTCCFALPRLLGGIR